MTDHCMGLIRWSQQARTASRPFSDIVFVLLRSPPHLRTQFDKGQRANLGSTRKSLGALLLRQRHSQHRRAIRILSQRILTWQSRITTGIMSISHTGITQMRNCLFAEAELHFSKLPEMDLIDAPIKVACERLSNLLILRPGLPR